VKAQVHDKSELSYATKQMRLFLNRHPDNCGISAPNFRVYERFMLLRTNDGVGFIEMYNPRYVVRENSPVVEVKEAKLMCDRDSQGDSLNERARKITVTYENFVGETVTVNMSNKAAYCVQHFVDILDGNWPCENSGRRVPEDPWAFDAADHSDL
jgi:peptide deformylase